MTRPISLLPFSQVSHFVQFRGKPIHCLERDQLEPNLTSRIELKATLNMVDICTLIHIICQHWFRHLDTYTNLEDPKIVYVRCVVEFTVLIFAELVG